MIDYARITVIAGSGGRGAGSFTHIKGKRRGKADGGDGGRGGNVLLSATRDLNTLESFRYVKEYRAKNGVGGASRLRRGADGQDLVIKVPVGTQVKVTDVTDGPQEPDAKSRGPLARLAPLNPLEPFDLVNEGDKVLVARSGEGGRGNAKLRDEYGRRPLAGERGEPGEVKKLTLELKLIADVGLIGLPNSGKSTLLSVLTAAKPQIADYPFTTLEPNLGVLTTDYRLQTTTKSDLVTAVDSRPLTVDKPASLVLADIPGLIAGASKGRGLGDLFLRHIERTKTLVHLIDVSTETDKWQDYQTIRSELKEYSKELSEKKEIIVLTKIDLVAPENLTQILNLFKSKKKKVMAISAKVAEGLDDLVKKILNPRY